MARRKPQDEQDFGSDSFLDVIANIVGILIILVIVAGLRVKQFPASADTADAREAQAALAAATSEAHSLEREVSALTRQADELLATVTAAEQRREGLSSTVAERQNHLDHRRAADSADTAEQAKLSQSIVSAKARLAKLTQDKEALSTTKNRIEVVAYPTPISRIVHGEEAHFQIKGGRIAPIPLEELLAKFKSQAQNKIYRLRNQPEFSDTVGPVDGFRLKYVVERIDAAQSGSYAQLRHFLLLPMSDDLGETLEEALAERSRFRSVLAGLRPKQTVVTLWAYDDSFEAFRALRKELYNLGFSVAGRPMEQGQPIGGSPHGSKSAAQ